MTVRYKKIPAKRFTGRYFKVQLSIFITARPVRQADEEQVITIKYRGYLL